MNFRTEIKSSPVSSIQHPSKILTMGSCFSDSIGQRLRESKFETSVNPFGISYNPLALHEVLALVLQNDRPPEELLIQHNDQWHHLLFHSKWSSDSKESLQNKLAFQLQATYQFLTRCNTLVLTYGTAWTYEHTQTGAIVANCHKIPAKEFSRFLVSPSQIIDSFQKIFLLLQQINPTLQIILTVSPVRHTRDTLELNSVSKSILRMACHYLVHQFNQVRYFPAYEIMLDDLRDYRFYDPDMIHPNSVAIDYIWEKFSDAYFLPDTVQLIKKIEVVRKALAHRPFREGTAPHQQFLRTTLQQLEELNHVVDVEQEIMQVKSQLTY